MADESFRRPGSVPFKWEIEPGVPKVSNRRRSTTLGELLTKLSPPPSQVSPPPSPLILRSVSASSFKCHVHQHVKSAASFQRHCLPVPSDIRTSFVWPFKKSLQAKDDARLGAFWL